MRVRESTSQLRVLFADDVEDFLVAVISFRNTYTNVRSFRVHESFDVDRCDLTTNGL